jgi:hypothetical protein
MKSRIIGTLLWGKKLKANHLHNPNKALKENLEQLNP